MYAYERHTNYPDAKFVPAQGGNSEKRSRYTRRGIVVLESPAIVEDQPIDWPGDTKRRNQHCRDNPEGVRWHV